MQQINFFSTIRASSQKIWRPPTPPRDENDLYEDPCLAWYDSTPIRESCLPPVYIKRENNKRIKIEHSKSKCNLFVKQVL